ncbi:MAG: hypothetical protein LBP79_01250 [Clostridiales bacterium]|jgi:hypothetical protein|nr:hypothetical protein [Clostridiales bacterium]
MRYLSYTEYRNLGGNLDVAAFTRQIFRAEKKVDIHTVGRLIREPEISVTVKACLRRLVDYMHTTDGAESGGKTVSAVSNDGVSVTYAAAPTQAEITAKEEAIIYEYLARETDGDGVPLLYRGV